MSPSYLPNDPGFHSRRLGGRDPVDTTELLQRKSIMNARPFRRLLIPVLLAGLGGMLVGRVTAQSLTILHQFAGGTNDGSQPLWMHLIQASDGNFYGTTEYGGISNVGTVFKITSSGSLTVLYQFKGGPANDGEFPEAGLVQGSDGNFYGTTYEGGRVHESSYLSGARNP